MTKPTQSRAAVTSKASREAPKKTIPFASRQSLACRQGPAIMAIYLPVAEEFLFVRRPHLPTLAKSGRIPKPLTAAITSLTQVGIAQTKQNVGAERYLEMALALARACAVVPPPEAVAEAEAVAEILADIELLEPLVTREQFPQPGSYQLAVAEAALADAKAHERARERALAHLAGALVGVDPDRQKSLFVEPDEEPDDDQLILVQDPEETLYRERDQVCALHRNDLVEIVTEIFTHAPGAMARFRREP